jgi:hypothetical protein
VGDIEQGLDVAQQAREVIHFRLRSGDLIFAHVVVRAKQTPHQPFCPAARMDCIRAIRPCQVAGQHNRRRLSSIVC